MYTQSRRRVRGSMMGSNPGLHAGAFYPKPSFGSGKSPSRVSPTRPVQSAKARKEYESPVRNRLQKKPIANKFQSSQMRKSQSPVLKRRQQPPTFERSTDYNTPTRMQESHTPSKSKEQDFRIPKSTFKFNEDENDLKNFSDMRLGEDAGGAESNFSWNVPNQKRGPTELKKMPTYNPVDIEWTDEEIKAARHFATKHINLTNNAYDDACSQNQSLSPRLKKKSQFFQQKSSQQGFCLPSCKKGCDPCNFEYDYTKSHHHHISQRPGIDFNLTPKMKVEKSKASDNGKICEFGLFQTPINLSTKQEVNKYFKDKAFKFDYEKIDHKQKQIKFNQGGDAFFVDIAKGRTETQNPNFLRTQTISLFDPHIPYATLQAVQFHFHAPSEHSINGQLMDLEMHIVHLLDGKREHNNASFGAGVLGFFFKVVPEEYFTEMNIRYPQAEMEWHDKFLAELGAEEKQRFLGNLESNIEGMDLKEFVQRLNFNKRWTYPGSLTTAPCDEGILWNVVEAVIPIRQSTLDTFVKMRKVEQDQITNPIDKIDAKTRGFLEEIKEEIPAEKRSRQHRGCTFMRLAGCNRKVQDINGRPVHRIDCQD